MANTDPAPEPTMEEILASIRRIISDDDKPEADNDQAAEPAIDAVEAEAEPPAAEPTYSDEPVYEEAGASDQGVEETAAFATDAPAGPDEGDEEIFELTDVVVSDNGPAADTGHDVRIGEETLTFENAGGDIDFVDAGDAALGTGEPSPYGEQYEAPEPEAEPMMQQAEVDAAFADRAASSPTSSGDAGDSVRTGMEPLLSLDADTAAATAFSALAQTLVAQRGQSRTVEDLIQDMLRPMLKQWLDHHLPGIVEEMVRSEIERVTRRAGR